jgi:hypothetical protein
MCTPRSEAHDAVSQPKVKQKSAACEQHAMPLFCHSARAAAVGRCRVPSRASRAHLEPARFCPAQNSPHVCCPARDGGCRRVGHEPAVTLGVRPRSLLRLPLGARGVEHLHDPWGWLHCACHVYVRAGPVRVLSRCRMVTGERITGNEAANRADSMADCTNAAIRNIFRTPGPNPPQMLATLPSRPVCRVRLFFGRHVLLMHCMCVSMHAATVPCTADAVVEFLRAWL